MNKKVLVIGSGGREHALGWNLAKDKEVIEVLYAPGNAGTAEEEKGRNVPLDAANKDNFSRVADLIRAEEVTLTVVGPEQPLADGLVDHLASEGIHNVIGPTMKASALEGDKFFSYDLMLDLNIPQARSVICSTAKGARTMIERRTSKEGIVLKARGLTGGKGVIVCDSVDEALAAYDRFSQTYGEEVLVAERLFGQEFSVFGISDGERVLPLELSLQDHKPLLDGDKGPNTGGMGAYGPAPIAPPSVIRKVVDTIMTPVVREMKNWGHEYKGFLYAGMIMTKEGPKVLEFNIRFGDPEAQPAMMLLQNSLYEPLLNSVTGGLKGVTLEFKPGASCCVVLSSNGYPKKYEKGLPISGLEDVVKMEGVKVFHAGTRREGDQIVTAGGRVLGVAAYSEQGSLVEAQTLAYEAVAKLSIPGGFSFRTDIGNKALKGGVVT